MNDAPAALTPSFSAVVIYDMTSSAPLADAAEVAAALGDPKILDSFFLKDLESCFEMDPGDAMMRRAVDIYELKDSLFAFTTIRAANGTGETYMPVILDQNGLQVLVVGPGETSPAGAAGNVTPAGAAGNVTYVSARDADAVKKVNDFLYDAAQRADKADESFYRFKSPLVSLMQAFALGAEIPSVMREGTEDMIRGASVGTLAVAVAQGNAEVTLWSAAVRKPVVPGM